MARNRPPETPGLTDEDLALWRNATRADAPLRGGASAGSPEPDSPKDRDVHPDSARAAPPRGGAPNKIDRRTRRRLRDGKIPFDEEPLDMHGMTVADAHRALNRAVEDARARGDRWVLVITGRSGVLRWRTPEWLDELRNAGRVRDFETAGRLHGGEGAIYVLIG